MSMKNSKPLKKYLLYLLSPRKHQNYNCVLFENQENENLVFKDLQKMTKCMFKGKLCPNIFNLNKIELKGMKH